MRKCNLCKKVILVSGLTLTMLMTACSGSEKPGDMLIGSWVSEYNDIVTFEKDGRCTAPFTYNASWWESADHYTVKEDGTLVLSSSEGQEVLMKRQIRRKKHWMMEVCIIWIKIN